MNTSGNTPQAEAEGAPALMHPHATQTPGTLLPKKVIACVYRDAPVDHPNEEEILERYSNPLIETEMTTTLVHPEQETYNEFVAQIKLGNKNYKLFVILE